MTRPKRIRRLNVGFIPTGTVGERLTRMRRELNELAAPAHVNLAHRVPTNQLDEEIERAVADVTKDLVPFEIVISGIETFLPVSNAVVAQVAPAGQLEKLHRQLVDALGWQERYDFVPHLSLYGDGMRANANQIENMAKMLRARNLREVALLDTLTITEKHPDGSWKQIMDIAIEERCRQ